MESKLFNNRIIFLTGHIDDDLANSIIEQLLYLEYKNPYKDIAILINSPGGSVTSGFAIYDTMNLVNCDIQTICMGLAASMASFLLSAGAPGKRYALPNSEVMIHQPHSMNEGQASDLIIRAKHISRIKNKMIKIMAQNCDQPIDKVAFDMDRDYFMSAKEALRYGIVDKIIG